MNRTQAWTQLTKLLGKKAAMDDTKKSTSQEKRDATKIARTDARIQKNAAWDAVEQRRKELLSTDARYQELLAIHKELSDKHDALPYDEYRYSAGTIDSMLGLGRVYHVVAQADSLDELVAKVKASKQKVKA